MQKNYKYKEDEEVLIEDSGHKFCIKIVSVNDEANRFSALLGNAGKDYDYLYEYAGRFLGLRQEKILGKIGNGDGEYKKYLTEIKILAYHQLEHYAISEKSAKEYHRNVLKEQSPKDMMEDVFSPEIVGDFLVEEID